MPTSVHKVLIHGKEIIQFLLLPIGQMSEEAQESCNKYIKNYRENFARKFSRAKNLEDVFLRLLVNSDPIISTLRTSPAKKSLPLLPKALNLLTEVQPFGTYYTSDISDLDTDCNYSDED